MRRTNIGILRGVLAIILGVVLVMWPEAAIIYMIMVIGACFLLPGIYSIVGYFLRNKENEVTSPMWSVPYQLINQTTKIRFLSESVVAQTALYIDISNPIKLYFLS